ncbi:MAG: methyltransferase-like protein [Ilumatobacteraceae bacterium]|nr:methyltransferase-like protein [Ilumatobacteraceae bacterium]
MTVIADHVAEEFAEVAGHLSGPVLDAGCGAGLTAVALVRDTAGEGVEWIIDGADISAATVPMAAALRRPDGSPLYRQVVEADVTVASDDLPAGSYAGVLCSHMFTTGKLGVGALTELIRLGRPGAIFSIGIDLEHFQEHEFAEHLGELVDDGVIRNLDPRIADPDTPHNDSGEPAVVLLFRRV